jgi:hypothetical protein
VGTRPQAAFIIFCGPAQLFRDGKSFSTGIVISRYQPAAQE